MSEKCPKAWELYKNYYLYELNNYPKNFVVQNLYIDDPNQFIQHFGILVLEFFPKHGIEIYIMPGKDGKYYWINEYTEPIYTPQETIQKALEILEKKL